MSTQEATKVASFDFKAFENADVLTIATAMAQPGITDEVKYKLAKLMLERTKTVFIDPMKEFREKEKAEEQKKAEEHAALIAEFRDRLNTLINDEVIEDFGTIAADYIEAGHGQVVSVEIFAKKDPETGEVKAEFSSNISKPRAKRGTSTRTRESGSAGVGVYVSGSPKEGVVGPTISKTEYKSFADAARELGFITDDTNMKGLNSKRLLEGKGYICSYMEKSAETPVGASAVRSRR